MKLKTVEIEGKTYAAIEGGKPVYIHDDGKEVPTDVPGMVARISAVNSEAKTNRQRAETAEASLKLFEGIEDPKAAVAALATVSNLDDKKLVDAGDVEKVKAQVSKAYEEKIEAMNKASTEKYDAEKGRGDKLEGELYSEKIGGRFARSKFIAEKLVIPSDLAQSHFGSHFKIEDGNVVGYDAAGSKIQSRENPTVPADFEEVLSILVETYSHKDSILKGSGAGGGGKHNNGAGGGDGKSISRTAFDQMKPEDRSVYMQGGGNVTEG